MDCYLASRIEDYTPGYSAHRHHPGVTSVVKQKPGFSIVNVSYRVSNACRYCVFFARNRSILLSNTMDHIPIGGWIHQRTLRRMISEEHRLVSGWRYFSSFPKETASFYPEEKIKHCISQLGEYLFIPAFRRYIFLSLSRRIEKTALCPSRWTHCCTMPSDMCS